MKIPKIKAEGIFIAVIAVMACALIIKALVSAVSTGTKYKTVLAEYGTLTLSDSVTGFVIRDEEPVFSTKTGTVIPVVNEGTKVNVGGEVARVFPDVDYATFVEQSEKLREELDYYESIKTNADAYVANIPVYNRNILNSVFDYAAGVSGGDYTGSSSAASTVREYITVKQIVLGQEINVEDKIAELKNEIDVIERKNLGNKYTSVSIERSGFYFSVSDGYENAFDYSAVESITASQTESLLSAQNYASPSGIGKTVFNSLWYFVCVVPREDAERLEYFGEYDITFRDSAAGTIKMRVDAINEDEESGNFAVVFSSKYMNGDIASLRKVNAVIAFRTYSGLTIPRSAVRTVDFEYSRDVLDDDGNPLYDAEGNVRRETYTVSRVGVFVRFNNVSKFRRVNILYSDGEKCIAELITDSDTGEYLKLNDDIFVEGVGLEDEHIIKGGYF